MTQQWCIDVCKKAGQYAYAAIENGTNCHCGNWPPKEERYAECRQPCPGNFDEYCGANGKNGIASWFMTGNGADSKFKGLSRRHGFSKRAWFLAN